MAEHSFSLRLVLVAAFLLQPAAPSSAPLDCNSKMPQDASGCARLAEFPQLAMSVVEGCDKGDSVEVTMPLKPDANGFAQEKKVRGAYQFREYLIPEDQRELAFDNLMTLVPIAGFQVQYSVKPSMITARNSDTWILINISGESYNVSVVHVPEQTWKIVTTAEEISLEMRVHNRVDIYGIEFSPSDQSIQEKQSPILFEIFKYLQRSPDLSVVIESHKVSARGTPEDDAKITRARGNAVMDWLVAHGIPKTRVQSKPFGRSSPLTDNESPTGIQRNERIVLARSTN